MDKRQEIKELGTPISKFLRENCDTGYKVIIDCDNIELVSEEMSIEISENE